MISLNQSLTGNRYTYSEQDPDYKGQELQSLVADGPVQGRRCTDCACCLLYLLFWVGLIIISFVAFTKGNPSLLAAPFDSAGYQCGYSKGYESTPYIIYNSFNTSNFACINLCPQNIYNITDMENYKCMYNGLQKNCIQFGVYNTTQIIDICYPINQDFSQSIDTYISFMQKSIADLKLCWPIELSILFIAFISSLILLYSLKYCGGCIVWSVMILYFLLLTGFGVTCFLMSKNPDIANQYISQSQLQDPSILSNIAYIVWAVDALSLLIFICYFTKIRVAIMIIKTAADFTRQRWQTIIIPILMFCLLGLFFTFWFIVSIYIFSTGEVSKCTNSPYGCIKWDVGVKRCLGYYFFGLFWNCEFAIAFCQFVISSTACFWYFSHLNKIPLHKPISRSFFRAIIYHIGSIAYGSLILCILWILQIIFQFLHWSFKNQTINPNPIENKLIKCCIDWARCCLACFQRFIRYISKNAFIMMALTGQGFCQSAHSAFYLIIRVRSQYAISTGIADLIIYFGKFSIAILCTFSGYLMITTIQNFSQFLFSPFMPCMMFFIISYVVATLFMDVFATGAESILTCYCVQMDINKGSTKSCPPSLRILNEYLV